MVAASKNSGQQFFLVDGKEWKLKLRMGIDKTSYEKLKIENTISSYYLEKA